MWVLSSPSWVAKKDKFLRQELLKPTKIYVKEVLKMIDKNLINGCANITGGGLEDNIKRMFTLLRMGIPVEALVKVITFSGFLEGKFTVDVARLLEPIVAMQIMSKAQVAEVPAKITLEDTEDTEFYKDMAKVKKSIDLDNLPMDKMTEEKIEKESVKGLMEK